eukprot:CAMPEP_0116870414 /NCGR_PEP_ID=MMETSP0463-20121206/302_1 /TAXON_ID=181622 /ORGANISM="Strombidinopsis sp, Strain SopsisLIS2011" /LENGTH=84 /DNA_ID=CAMNT_0004506887 /DNA_START=408 /DNA_END=662 /DNA_ORIENTATION=+
MEKNDVDVTCEVTINSFIKCDPKAMEITINSTTSENAGNYTVTITLSDYHLDDPLKSTYEFNIEIKAQSDESISEEEQREESEE